MPWFELSSFWAIVPSCNQLSPCFLDFNFITTKFSAKAIFCFIINSKLLTLLHGCLHVFWIAQIWLDHATHHVWGSQILSISKRMWYLFMDIWVKIFRNGPCEIFGRQPLKNSNFLKAVFQKFYLVRSWIPWPIYWVDWDLFQHLLNFEDG